MRRLLRAGYLLAVAAILMLPVSSAAAHKSSRIETRRGEVYLGCEFEVNDVYRVLEVSCPEAKRNVGFSDVAHIYDEAGVDVTEKYLGEYYRPDSTESAPTREPSDTATVTESPPPEQRTDSDWMDESARSEREHRRPRPLEASISIFPAISVPLGDYYEGMTGGVGFGGEVTISVSRLYALRFGVEKQGVKVSHDGYIDVARQIGITVLDHDVKATMMRYVASFEYHGWPNQERGGRWWWYASTGLGAISHKFSGTMLAIDPYTMDPAYFRIDDTQTKFVGTAALGIVPMLSPNLGLECCFDWDLVFVGTTESSESYAYGDQVQVASVLDFRVGLTYVFK